MENSLSPIRTPTNYLDIDLIQEMETDKVRLITLPFEVHCFGLGEVYTMLAHHISMNSTRY